MYAIYVTCGVSSFAYKTPLIARRTRIWEDRKLRLSQLKWLQLSRNTNDNKRIRTQGRTGVNRLGL